MRKIKYLIITFLISLCLLPVKALASGSVSVSTSSLSITTGGSASFTITAYNAAGRADISSSNYGVAGISESSAFLDGSSEVVTVSGNAAGTAVITVKYTDFTTYDDENISGGAAVIYVTVSDPYVPSAPGNNNNNNYNNYNNNTNNNTTTNTDDNKSKNNNLASIKVDGYDLVKVDNNNYTLKVQNDVSNINVNATAEDAKTKITGTGKHDLKVGENTIEIVLTSESGAENKIVIKVTRKDGYYIEDLDYALKSSGKDINIILSSDSKVTSKDLAKIKASKKKVSLNYFDKDKKLIYSWLLDGSKINNTKELATEIEYTSKHVKEISKLSNYADGLYLTFKNSGNMPNGTKIKIFVGNKYKNGDALNIYYYDIVKNKLTLMEEKLKVKDGYIEFSLEHGSEYFITMSQISNVKKSHTQINIFMILFILETVGVLIYIGMYFIKKNNDVKSSKKDDQASLNDAIKDSLKSIDKSKEEKN